MDITKDISPMAEFKRDSARMIARLRETGRPQNLGHGTTRAGRGVLIASTYRRLQQFFQHVALGPD